jgi:hypothetical protein
MTTMRLRSELSRLGCAVRGCGPHGYIFMPTQSGGINLEGSKVHFWDCGVNARVASADVERRLCRLPDGAGFRRTWTALLEMIR